MYRASGSIPFGSSANPHQWPPPVSPVSPGTATYWILSLGTAIHRWSTNICRPFATNRYEQAGNPCHRSSSCPACRSDASRCRGLGSAAAGWRRAQRPQRLLTTYAPPHGSRLCSDPSHGFQVPIAPAVGMSPDHRGRDRAQPVGTNHAPAPLIGQELLRRSLERCSAMVVPHRLGVWAQGLPRRRCRAAPDGHGSTTDRHQRHTREPG